MRVTVSAARGQLGHLCARAQDPREVIVLTRHGRDIAAVVSMDEVKRIWAMQDNEWLGRRNPLTGRRPIRGMVVPEHLVSDAKGRLVTRHEAAEQMREIQMTRAEERRVLEAGGLEAVEGGEIGETVVVRRGWVQCVLERIRGMVSGAKRRRSGA
ncbi:MAG: prevent-host-death family protein [Paracoccaceae bacterium]|jgi:prevent-host-death family protein